MRPVQRSDQRKGGNNGQLEFKPDAEAGRLTTDSVGVLEERLCDGILLLLAQLPFVSLVSASVVQVSNRSQAQLYDLGGMVKSSPGTPRMQPRSRPAFRE